jgi:hypothetical protein
MSVQGWVWFGGFVLAAFLHAGVKATGGKAGLSYGFYGIGVTLAIR